MNHSRVAPEPQQMSGWTLEDTTPQDDPEYSKANLVSATSASSQLDTVAVEELQHGLKDPEVWKPQPAQPTTTGGLNSIAEMPEDTKGSAKVNFYSHKGPPAYDKASAASKLDHHKSPADSNSSSFDRADSLSKLRHEVGKVTKVFLSTVSCIIRVPLFRRFLTSYMYCLYVVSILISYQRSDLGLPDFAVSRCESQKKAHVLHGDRWRGTQGKAHLHKSAQEAN
jgi:hypothetical protein